MSAQAYLGVGRIVIVSRQNMPTPAMEITPNAVRVVLLDSLAEYLEKQGLIVVGGDPDLLGNPWQPTIYVMRRDWAQGVDAG